MAVDGVGLGAIAIGSVFAYAGLKGYSVPAALQSIVQGKSPATLKPAAPIEPPTDSTSSPSSTAGGPANSSETAWIQALLSALGAPDTSANESSLARWIGRETPWPPVAKNNALNTTENAPGATAYNSIGVKNYPDAATGIQATVTTLQGYPTITLLLRAGKGVCGSTAAADFSRWSGGGYSSVC